MKASLSLGVLRWAWPVVGSGTSGLRAHTSSTVSRCRFASWPGTSSAWVLLGGSIWRGVVWWRIVSVRRRVVSVRRRVVTVRRRVVTIWRWVVSVWWRRSASRWRNNRHRLGHRHGWRTSRASGRRIDGHVGRGDVGGCQVGGPVERGSTGSGDGRAARYELSDGGSDGDFSLRWRWWGRSRRWRWWVSMSAAGLTGGHGDGAGGIGRAVTD